MPDGSLPAESDLLLTEQGAWMAVNGAAIHDTRPWSVYGEGPTEAAAGMFKEKADYSARDIRFTTKGKTLYAIVLGEPAGTVTIAALRATSGRLRGRIAGIALLGAGAVPFRQTAEALTIVVPARLPTRHASVFAIDLA